MSKRKLGKAKAAATSPAGTGSARRRRQVVIKFPVKVGRITREQAEAAVDAVMRERRDKGGTPPLLNPTD